MSIEDLNVKAFLVGLASGTTAIEKQLALLANEINELTQEVIRLNERIEDATRKGGR